MRVVVVEIMAEIATIIVIDLMRVDPVGLTRACASLMDPTEILGILGILGTLETVETRGIRTTQGTVETLEILATIIGRLVANLPFVKRPQVASARRGLLLTLGMVSTSLTIQNVI